MRIIFLDVDGCMNTHDFCPRAKSGTWHPDKVNVLNHVLELTDARIVLSSAWRYLVHNGHMKLCGLEWLLRSHGVIADRLIGVTRRDTMETWEPFKHDPDATPRVFPRNNERGQQITDWMAMNHRRDALDGYVVVDDMDLGITAAGHPLVLCDHDVGLGWGHADDMMNHLYTKPKTV